MVTLREAGEVDWDEPKTVRELGLEFHRLGFRAPDTLTDAVFDKARKILTTSKDKPVLLHCGSANRVGAVWMAHRVLDHGLSIQDAEKEANEVGLRTEQYRKKAIEYIQRKKKQ